MPSPVAPAFPLPSAAWNLLDQNHKLSSKKKNPSIIQIKTLHLTGSHWNCWRILRSNPFSCKLMGCKLNSIIIITIIIIIVIIIFEVLEIAHISPHLPTFMV